MRVRICLVSILILAIVASTRGQDAAPATPLTLVSRDGRRTVPTLLQNGREVIALDDVASLFQVSVKEDTLAGGVTVSYRGRTIVAFADRPMASVEGRVVSLPSPVLRAGRRWLVPVEFLAVALASIYDQRIELRRASRLLVVGDIRLPRVTATIDGAGPPTRASIEVNPAAAIAVASDPGRVSIRIDADGLDLAPSNAGGLIDRIRPGDQPNTLIVQLTDAAGVARATVTTANNVARVVLEVPAASTSDARDANDRAAPAEPGAQASGARRLDSRPARRARCDTHLADDCDRPGPRR